MAGTISAVGFSGASGAAAAGPSVVSVTIADPPPIQTRYLAQSPDAGQDGPPAMGEPIQAPEGAPPEADDRDLIETAVAPEVGGVLTPQGRFVLEPIVEFTQSSDDRLVFRGVEIVPALLVGVIEASELSQETTSFTMAARYGLTDRLEVEARVPYRWRSERSTILLVRDQEIERTQTLRSDGLGDIEVGLRYELPRPGANWPYMIAGLSAKTPTGVGPFDVERDADGVARELPLGSGFWGVRGTLTAIYPVQPAVLYGSIGYLHSFARDVDESFGDDVTVGRVDPGDTISASVGMGFSVTPDFSYSLGYTHDYILGTEREINGVTQSDDAFHVGALQFGLSYDVTDTVRTNLNFEFGVTNDAPDLRVAFRVPIQF